MHLRNKYVRVTIISLLVAAILFLHYFTLPHRAYYHAVYRMLFYLPLIMAGFWFGMKGALSVCAAVLLLFSPYVVMRWHGLSLQEFDTLLEGVLYIAAAFILGLLSEREKKERAARVQAERLAAIGKAVAEVAHDMKTPLMAIGGFTKQVARSLQSDNPNRRKLNIVLQQTDRMESMVREMLDFGRPLRLESTRANLNELVRSTLVVGQPMAKEAGVEAEIQLEPTLPDLFLDGPRMEQVILNLFVNAVQASPAGQAVRVRTFMKRNRVILEVSDSGSGIKDEKFERVFQPFFSTKKGGTGLGLAIAKKIVEVQGGQIGFHANPGKGVTFTIAFPAVKEKPGPSSQRQF
jgi:two-component system sensor histidine kinase HydH